MEQEFRTTFIPKKPIAQQPVSTQVTYSKPVGIIFTVSLVILIISGALGGGVYLYKQYLQGQVTELASSLEALQRNIDPNVIREFTTVDKRLKNSEVLVNQHAVLSPLFTVLRTTTLPEVRYTKLDMLFNDTRDLQVTLSGESDGYRSIALQSQALAKNTNLKNTIFSNFVVTPKGRVSFDVSFLIPSTDLAFAKNIDSFSGPIMSQQEQAFGTSNLSTEQITQQDVTLSETVNIENSAIEEVFDSVDEQVETVINTP